MSIEDRDRNPDRLRDFVSEDRFEVVETTHGVSIGTEAPVQLRSLARAPAPITDLAAIILATHRRMLSAPSSEFAAPLPGEFK